MVSWIGVGTSRFLVGAGVSSVSDSVGIMVVGGIVGFTAFLAMVGSTGLGASAIGDAGVGCVDAVLGVGTLSMKIKC